MESRGIEFSRGILPVLGKAQEFTSKKTVFHMYKEKKSPLVCILFSHKDVHPNIFDKNKNCEN